MSAFGFRRAVRRAVAGSVLAFAWFSGSQGVRSTRAAEPSPVFLSFVGSASCGDRGALEREVEHRSDELSWSTSADTPTRVQVRIADGIGRVDSAVSIERAGSPAVSRAITARSCQEVLEASALIIVVLLSSRQSEPARPPQPAPELVSEIAPPDTEPHAAVASAWRFGAGAHAVIVEGIAPGVFPGFAAFAVVESDGTGWAPAFRVGYLRLTRSVDSANGGHAGFRLDAVALAACPASLGLARRWRLRPCATGSYGSLALSGGADGAAPGSVAHPWASLGASLRPEVSVARPLSLELELNSEAALVSSRFFFGEERFHQSSPVNGRGSVGVSLEIP